MQPEEVVKLQGRASGQMLVSSLNEKKSGGLVEKNQLLGIEILLGKTAKVPMTKGFPENFW